MRFLLHSSDCVYDSDTKRWVCHLAQRFSNPSQITLVAATYKCSTADSYPITVYLRSEALQRLAKSHHSIELAPHELISDALGVLRLSDDPMVFHLESRFRFPVHSHLTEQKLDFFFTDNRTILDGVYTAPAVPGVSDTVMQALVDSGDIRIWLDLKTSGNILNNDNDPAAIDDSVSKIISRTPGGTLQMSPNGVDKVAFKALGEGRGVTRQGAAAWSAISGSVAGVEDFGP